jgi:putative addiction module killer protein
MSLPMPTRGGVDQWMRGLRDQIAKRKVLTRLARVRTCNLGDCKMVARGVRELRIDHGPGYRVYFAEDGDILVVLLCAGDKSTQARDIQTAQEYWHDYQKGRQTERR